MKKLTGRQEIAEAINFGRTLFSRLTSRTTTSTGGTVMSKAVGNEFFCRSCGVVIRTKHFEYKCPECGSTEDVYNNIFVTCDCGTTVYLDNISVECPACGKRYRMMAEEERK